MSAMKNRMLDEERQHMLYLCSSISNARDEYREEVFQLREEVERLRAENDHLRDLAGNAIRGLLIRAMQEPSND